jgi:LDH2 family malate/lactate/ureidoglycolate dehydrogenase
LTELRYEAEVLREFATRLLHGAGLAADRAAVVADVLVEADLLGHDTHGLDMLARYLDEIAAGRMAREGEPETLRDSGSALTWDGRRLPGPWLVKRAIATARERLVSHPTVTVVIRRSHHIGCLQAYLKPVTDEGLVILLTCSDPSGAGVAPHGGVASRITPNPLAAGFPTGGAPVLLDVSMSTTTNALTKRLYEEGERLPGPWLVDADGLATDDPSVLFREPKGALLPLGGQDLGHKGFALALLIEALTSGLAGHGRADGPKEWGASVFLQLIDPGAFAGREAFVRETTRLAELCRTTPVAAGKPPVRLPGERALARRKAQLEGGVALRPGILKSLEPWAERLHVAMPAPVA